MLNEMLNYDLDSLCVKKYGLDLNNKFVEYAILTDGVKSLWYDNTFGYEMKFIKSTNVVHIKVRLDSTDIICTFYSLNNSGSTDMKKYSIPALNYTKESYFMESTLHDFGSFTFDNYKALQALVNKCHEVIGETEK